MKDQTFAHRPPTPGIHLLSDPLPDFPDRAPRLEETSPGKRPKPRHKNRKPGLES